MWTHRIGRTRHHTIFETRLPMDSRSIHMFDETGFPRRERKHWIHHFENITSILFVVDLDEYDARLWEDDTVCVMEEAFTLFDSVVNSRYFAQTSIILILNKFEVFKEKIPKSPLEKHFPDYTGGNDVNKAAKYLLSRFIQLNLSHLNIYPHFACSDERLGLIQALCVGVREGVLLRFSLDQQSP